MISRSAIEVLDKQDPSLATELLLLYEQFYDAGYLLLCRGLRPNRTCRLGRGPGTPFAYPVKFIV